jgi:CRP/FNR family transcriptional regulator, cyclic AMP receptor protein
MPHHAPAYGHCYLTMNRALQPQQLKQLALFSACNDAVIEQLITHSSLVPLQPGDCLHDAFAPGHFHLVIEGKLAIKYYALHGRELMLGELEAGQWCGNDQAQWPPLRLSAEAADACQVVRIEDAAFRQILEQEPHIFVAMFHALNQLVWVLAARLIDMGMLSVRSHLHIWLLNCAERTGIEGNSSLLKSVPTQSNLAAFFGTTREEVAREMSALSKSGLIQRVDRSLLIQDIAQLRRLVAQAR